ncbi:MAG: hypothetical protein ACO268_08815, partial [Opitutales bacterium]
RCAGLPVREVESGVPVGAEAVLVLRSTLPGGGAPASEWDDAEGVRRWSGDPERARRWLAALAAHRAQRAVRIA